MTKPLQVKCPTCRRLGEWLSTPWGPFCSKRCRLIDLGKWLNEEHRLSEDLRPEHLEHIEDLPLLPPDSKADQN